MEPHRWVGRCRQTDLWVGTVERRNAIARLQQAADQGMDVMVGEAARPVTGVPAGENQFTDKRAVSGGAPPPAHTQGGWGDLKVHTTISTGDGTTGGDTTAPPVLPVTAVPDEC